VREALAAQKLGWVETQKTIKKPTSLRPVVTRLSIKTRIEIATKFSSKTAPGAKQLGQVHAKEPNPSATTKDDTEWQKHRCAQS